MSYSAAFLITGDDGVGHVGQEPQQLPAVALDGLCCPDDVFSGEGVHAATAGRWPALRLAWMSSGVKRTRPAGSTVYVTRPALTSR